MNLLKHILGSMIIGFVILLPIAFIAMLIAGKGGHKYKSSWLGWWKTVYKCPKCDKNLSRVEYDDNFCPTCKVKINE